MPRQPVTQPVGEAGGSAVALPAYDGTLAPASRERIRRLRQHLVAAMREERALKPRARAALKEVVPPAGRAAEVAAACCALCRGWCCSKGGEHAYLDERSMARVRRARPELDARAVLRLYTEAAADPAYAGSCVFHGAAGCTLERDLRSDLCNAYFCNGLAAALRQAEQGGEITLVAGAGPTQRRAGVAADAG